MAREAIKNLHVLLDGIKSWNDDRNDAFEITSIRIHNGIRGPVVVLKSGELEREAEFSELFLRSDRREAVNLVKEGLLQTESYLRVMAITGIKE